VRKLQRQSGQGSAPSPSLFGELKRRRVIHAVSLYAVASWGLVLGAAELSPVFGVSADSIRWLVVAAVCLAPVVAVVSWFFRLTPRGLLPELDLGVEDHTIAAPLQHRSFINAQWLGHQRRFFNSFVVGRDPACGFCVDDDQISRRHMSVAIENGQWWLEDLNSRNGTMVNGELISKIEMPEAADVVLYQNGPVLKLYLEREGDA